MTLRFVSLSSPAPYPLTILLRRLRGDRAITILCSIQRFVQITVVGLLIFAGTLSLAAESPTEVVRTTINDVIRILEDKELKAPAKLLSRRHLLEDVIAQRFDYAEMSKRALAANWTPLTNKQRDEFVGLFKAFLSDRYAAKIEGYSGEQVEYLNERVDGQFAEVRTKLVSSKVEIPMDYRLLNRAGRWYAYDIIVDGVSLVKNYRSQFTSIIRSSSYEELVHRLRNRTVDERHTG
jgi:phospholipid transport system substrate-binding protein